MWATPCAACMAAFNDFNERILRCTLRLYPLGPFGHINPTLALVTELVKQGVRVTYFTTEAFRNIIEPTGAKFVAVPSWMAENDKHNDGEKKEDDGGVAAAVPFLFLNEAGAYIDTILDTLHDDKPDAIVHDFAGIAGTIAADNLNVPNVMLYTSYPSNARCWHWGKAR